MRNGISGDLQPRDVYKFFTNVVHKNPNNAQQIEADCLYCGRTVPSTGSYKLVDHIMKQCPVCPCDVSTERVAASLARPLCV